MYAFTDVTLLSIAEEEIRNHKLTLTEYTASSISKTPIFGIILLGTSFDYLKLERASQKIEQEEELSNSSFERFWNVFTTV